MDSLISMGPMSMTSLTEDVGVATTFNHWQRNREWVDVTFIVETPEGEIKEFYAHKLILAMRSTKFADQFYGGENEEHFTVRLKRVNPTAFEAMIRYCYGIKPRFETTKEACDLFDLAKNYKLMSLMNQCRAHLRDIKITPENVFSMLNVAESMQEQSLKDRCNKVLEEKTRDVLSAYDMRDFTPAMVHKILDLPKLTLHSEYDLVDWLIRWGDVKAKEGDKHCENAREYLEKLLTDINILALTFEEFALLCKDYRDFFCPVEIASIFVNLAFPGTREMPDWYDKNLKVRQYIG